MEPKEHGILKGKWKSRKKKGGMKLKWKIRKEKPRGD